VGYIPYKIAELRFKRVYPSPYRLPALIRPMRCASWWFVSLRPRRNILFPPAGGQAFPQGKPSSWAHRIWERAGRRRRISFCVNARAIVVLRILFRERDSVRNHINRDCPSTVRALSLNLPQ